MGDSFGTIAESAAKALSYAAVIAAIGVCAVRWRLVPALRPRPGADPTERLLVRLAHVGAAAGAVASAALLLRLWAHTVVAFGLADGLAWENIRIIAIDSRWGFGWRLQVIASLAAIAAFACAARWPSPGWPAASIAAAASAGIVPLLGHAAGDPVRTAIHAAHLLGAGIWLGSLAASVLATSEASAPNAAPANGALGAPVRAALLHELASVALPGSAVLVLSGVWVSWIYVGSPVNLVTSAYGRALLVKLALVGAVGLCGFVNRQRYRTVRRSSILVEPWRRDQLPGLGFVFLELVVAALVIVATSVLTELEHPTN